MFLRHFALICAGFWNAAPALAEAEFVGRFQWDREESFFGGLSGIELSADGRSFFIIGDSAIVLTGRIERKGGRIAQIVSEPHWIGGLSMPDGNRVGKGFTDAEGLALGDGGEVFVSFEGTHRVWRYRGRDGPATELPALPADLHFRRNGGLEALARAPDGALWAIPERPPRGWDRLPVLRLGESGWDIAGTLSLHPRFAPVGADFGDDGALYLLERGLGLGGFSSRVRRLEAGAERITEGTLILETEPGSHGNLEGLSVWRDGDGALMLTMVADDNYSRFQTTEIVEYRVTE